MASVVGEIVIDVTADVGPLVRQMGKAEGAMGGLQGAAGRMGQGLSRAGGMAFAFGQRMAIVAAGVAAVTGVAVVFVKNAAAMGDAIADASKAAGMSTTAFQEYRFALKEAAAMTDEDFASAAARLNKTLGEAREGSASAVKAFEAIGISQAQLADASFTTDQAMAAFVASMEAATDPATAAAVATDLFGKSGAGLGAALSGVPGQVGDLVTRAKELGVVLGPEAIAAASTFDQKMNELGASFGGLQMKLANELLPIISDYFIPLIENLVIPALSNLVGGLGLVIDGVQLLATGAMAGFEQFKTAVGGAVDWAVTKFNEFMALLDSVLQRAKEVGAAIADALTYQPGDGQIKNGPAPGALDGPVPDGSWIMNSSGSGSSSSGAAVADGLVNGLTMRMAERLPEVAAAMQMVTDTAKSVLGIQSPSTVFAGIGAFIGQGLAEGISSTNGIVATAVGAMGAGAVTATGGMVNDILGGLDTLLAGSQKAGAALALVNTFIGASQEIKKGTFGFASAAKVIAQGMGFVKTIKGAKGSGGSGGGGGSGSSAAAAPPQQATQNLGITFVNDPFGIGERTARAIATTVNEAQRNGIRLNVSIGQ